MTDLQKQDDEVEKAFKVLTDEESRELGLPTEPTPEDIAEGERARATTGGDPPATVPPEQSPLVAPKPKRWEELPQRVRDELEAGRRALGGGGLSAEQAYYRSLEEPRVVPPPPMLEPVEPPPVPTERTKVEMAAGAAALRRHQDEIAHSQRIAAELKAKAVAEGAPADAMADLNYNVPR